VPVDDSVLFRYCEQLRRLFAANLGERKLSGLARHLELVNHPAAKMLAAALYVMAEDIRFESADLCIPMCKRILRELLEEARQGGD